jgi:hypothetical protein
MEGMNLCSIFMNRIKNTIRTKQIFSEILLKVTKDVGL